jgi:multidrug efflux pump subunit AcrA (membrane-fusion protein)
MNRISTVLSGTCLVVAGAAIGWILRDQKPSGAEAHEEEASTPAAEMRVSVTTVPATIGDLPIVAVAPGVVQAEPSAEHVVTTWAWGLVIETDAMRGQRVDVDDVLLRIDERPLRTALATARSNRTQAANQLAEFETVGREARKNELQAAARRAAAQVTLLEAQSTRLEPLHQDGLVADKTLMEARQAAEQARADRELADLTLAAFSNSGAELQHATLVAARDAAQANERDAERAVDEAVVKSPVAGQVVEFLARPGARLESGTVVARILTDGNRVIASSVGIEAARQIRVGAHAVFGEVGGERISGTVVRMGGSVDATGGAMEVVVAPDAGQVTPIVGASLRGEIELSRLDAVVLVPDAAVVRTGDRQTVVVAVGGRAKSVPVVVLGRHAGMAAIRGDVKAGDHVVVDGGYNLPDGAGIVEPSR